MKKAMLPNREESKSFDLLKKNKTTRQDKEEAQLLSNNDKGIKKYFRVKRAARVAAEEIRLNLKYQRMLSKEDKKQGHVSFETDTEKRLPSKPSQQTLCATKKTLAKTDVTISNYSDKST